VAQFFEFKIGTNGCRLLAHFRAGPADEDEIAERYPQRTFCSLQSLPLHTQLKTMQSDQLTVEFIMEGRNIFCRRARPLVPMTRANEPVREVSPLPNHKRYVKLADSVGGQPPPPLSDRRIARRWKLRLLPHYSQSKHYPSSTT
jgi:hypothetical protein